MSKEFDHKKFMEYQCEEMKKYKWIESQKAGYDLGYEATRDWVMKYAPAFRKWAIDSGLFFKEIKMVNPALNFIELSRIAYWKEKKLNQYLEKNYDQHVLVKVKNDFAFVCKSGRDIIVSIAGTDDFKDVLADLNVFPKKVKDLGWVHRGIYNATNDLIAGVRSAILNLSENEPYVYDIYFTGHSLGGAIAMMMPMILMDDQIIPKSIYTFGAPKPGKGSFAEYFKVYKRHCYQFVMKSDPVPRAPRSYFFWEHPGVITWLENKADRSWGFLWFGKANNHKSAVYHKVIKKM